MRTKNYSLLLLIAMVQTNASQNCELPTSTHQKKLKKNRASEQTRIVSTFFLKGTTDDTA